MAKRAFNSIGPARRRGPTSGPVFKRDQLPSPAEYYEGEGVRLLGRGEWRSAVCPFHDDAAPSLRVHLTSGAFCCMACGTHGGDVLSFHMQRHGLWFVEAAKALGAWGSR